MARAIYSLTSGTPEQQAARILNKFGNGIKGGLLGFVQNSAGRVALRMAGQTFPMTKEEGEAAVMKDVNRAFAPIGALLARANRKRPGAAFVVAKLAKEGKTAEANKFLLAIGAGFTVSETVDRQQHIGNRDKKTGRVKRPTKDVLIMDRTKVESYAISGPMKRVGTAAHGWVQASRAAGRKRRSADVLKAGVKFQTHSVQAFKDKPAETPAIQNGTAEIGGTADAPVVTISNSFNNLKRITMSQAVGFALKGESEILAKQVHAAAKSEARKLGLSTYQFAG